MYRIETPSFFLELDPGTVPVDTPPEECIFIDIKLCCSGFSAQTTVREFLRGLVDFADDLKALDDSAKGSARLRGFASDQYIEFSAQKGGYMKVTGQLTLEEPDDCTQVLSFENRLGFTMEFRKFASRLHHDFSGFVNEWRKKP